MKNFYRILLACLILASASLACTIGIGGPDYPDAPIPVSTEAVQQLQDQVAKAIAQAAITGSLVLDINETQITSLIAFKLAEKDDPMFTNPQVYLRDGQMQVFGKAHQGVVYANIGIILSPGIDDKGQLKIDLVSADFGPLPVPEGLNKAISALVTEAYTGSLGPVATGVRLDSITIANGVMTLVGQVK